MAQARLHPPGQRLCYPVCCSPRLMRERRSDRLEEEIYACRARRGIFIGRDGIEPDHVQ
jgi:hypothetical protein